MRRLSCVLSLPAQYKRMSEKLLTIDLQFSSLDKEEMRSIGTESSGIRWLEVDSDLK
jgi:hypothetical protein